MFFISVHVFLPSRSAVLVDILIGDTLTDVSVEIETFVAFASAPHAFVNECYDVSLIDEDSAEFDLKTILSASVYCPNGREVFFLRPLHLTDISLDVANFVQEGEGGVIGVLRLPLADLTFSEVGVSARTASMRAFAFIDLDAVPRYYLRLDV